MSTYFNRDEFIETYLEKFNDDFEESERYILEFQKVFSFIDDCDFDPNVRIWKKADLFTAIVEVHRAMFKNKMRLDVTLVSNELKRFYGQVDSVEISKDSESRVAKYHRAVNSATNDRGNRILRGEALQAIIGCSTGQQVIDFQ